MRIGNIEGLIEEFKVADNCPECQQMSQIKIKLKQKVFILGFPMFPHTKYTEIVCLHCKRSIAKNKAPQFVQQKINTELPKAKSLKWGYTGLFIIGIAFIAGLIMMQVEGSKMKEFIKDPKPGDIYVIEYKDETAIFDLEYYKLWRLEYLDQNSTIYFVESNIQADDLEDVNDILKLRNSDIWDSYTPFPLAEIQLLEMTNQLREETLIKEIHRY